MFNFVLEYQHSFSCTIKLKESGYSLISVNEDDSNILLVNYFLLGTYIDFKNNFIQNKTRNMYNISGKKVILYCCLLSIETQL